MKDQSHEKTLSESYGSQFEQSTLWLIVFDADFAETAYAVLSTALFDDAVNRALFECGRELYEQLGNGVVPGYTALLAQAMAQLQRAKPKTTQRTLLLKVVQLLQVLRKKKVNAGDAAFIGESIAQFVTKSKMRQALLAAGTLWEQGRFDEIVESVEEAAHSQARTAGKRMGSNFNDVKAKLSSYTESTKRESKKAPTGLPLLDAQMRGGLEVGNLAVVMAPAKRGKSQFLSHVGASALLAGLNVAVVTCELPEKDYSLRFDARLTGIPINEIAMHPKKHAKQIMRATTKLKASLFIHEYGSNSATVGDIYVWLKWLRSRHGFRPDMVIVDYADLLNTPKRKRDAPDLGAIYRSLRQMAFDFQTRVWTATQSNRGSYHGNRIALQDVAEDLQKVQIADVIVGIAQTPREFDAKLSRVVLLGNRLGGGEGLTISCHSYSETMELRQLSNQPSIVRRGR